MRRKIVVINGHPDPSPERFSAALAGAYLAGASVGGHQIRRLDVGELKLAPIRSMTEFSQPASELSVAIQEMIAWADHLVIIYPLWLGGPPAMLKAFFEQVFRYGFALAGEGAGMKGLLKGRSARVIVTMGMPAPIFRLVFAAAGLRAITRGILMICGVRPVRATVVGNIEGSAKARTAQLARVRAFGVAGV